MERTEVLSTRRTTLTTWQPDDLDDLHRMHSDPETMRFIGGQPETREESRDRLGRYLAEQETPGWTKWRVTDADGRMIGRAGFGTLDGHRDLGYTYVRSAWGQGIATEVAQALVAWHRANPELAGDGSRLPLSGHAQVEHLASRRVLVKAGLVPVDVRELHGSACAYLLLPEETSG